MLSISVFLSGIVALTLTPTLCSIFLKDVKFDKAHEKMKPKFFQLFDTGFNKFRDYYIKLVNYLLDKTKLAYAIFAVVMVITGGLYKLIPTALIPLEDMGYYYTTVLLPGAASLDRTTVASVKLAKFLHSMPATYQTLALVGIDILDNSTNKTNAAFVVTTLKPWDERKKEKDQINSLITQTNKFGYMDKDARKKKASLPRLPPKYLAIRVNE